MFIFRYKRRMFGFNPWRNGRPSTAQRDRNCDTTTEHLNPSNRDVQKWSLSTNCGRMSLSSPEQTLLFPPQPLTWSPITHSYHPLLNPNTHFKTFLSFILVLKLAYRAYCRNGHNEMRQRQTILVLHRCCQSNGCLRADPHPAQDNEKWGANTQTDCHIMTFLWKRHIWVLHLNISTLFSHSEEKNIHVADARTRSVLLALDGTVSFNESPTIKPTEPPSWKVALTS